MIWQYMMKFKKNCKINRKRKIYFQLTTNENGNIFKKKLKVNSNLN